MAGCAAALVAWLRVRHVPILAGPFGLELDDGHDATATMSTPMGTSTAGIHDCGIVLMASPTLARW
jgi:hypothetical protein